MLYELKYNKENFNHYKEDYNKLIKEEKFSEELLINDFSDIVSFSAKGIYISNSFNTLSTFQFMKKAYQIFENDFSEDYLYGLCDNVEQVYNKYKELLEDKNRKFIIILNNIYRENQPEEYGFRFHKWGEYIGDFEITCEYLKNEIDMEKIIVFHVIEII